VFVVNGVEAVSDQVVGLFILFTYEEDASVSLQCGQRFPWAFGRALRRYLQMRSLPLVWMIFFELTKASCSFWDVMISFCVGVGMKVLWFLNLRNIMSE